MTRTDLRIQFAKTNSYQYHNVMEQVTASAPGIRTEYIDFLEDELVKLINEINETNGGSSS